MQSGAGWAVDPKGSKPTESLLHTSRHRNTSYYALQGGHLDTEMPARKWLLSSFLFCLLTIIPGWTNCRPPLVSPSLALLQSHQWVKCLCTANGKWRWNVGHVLESSSPSYALVFYPGWEPKMYIWQSSTPPLNPKTEQATPLALLDTYPQMTHYDWPKHR